jgi:hypothetical protein
MPNAGKHEGEPGLPFKVSLYALFLLFGRPVVVFGSQTLYRFRRPPFRVKSKRIFLSADRFYRVDPTERALPEGSFIVLCPAARSLHECIRLRKAIHSKKIC